MKKGCSLIIGFVIAIIVIALTYINIMSLITEKTWKMKELNNEDIRKYNYDINVEYKFNSYKYTININSDSIINIKENIDNNIGYHNGKCNGEYGILNEKNELVLSDETIFKKFNKKFSDIVSIKYNRTSNSIYFVLCYNSFNNTIASYNFEIKELKEIMKLNNEYYGYILLDDKIYALNEDKELCEYDIVSKRIKNFGIKPGCFDIKNSILAYSIRDIKTYNTIIGEIEQDRHREVCIYDLINNKIVNHFKTQGYISGIKIDKYNNFILTTESMPGFTNLNAKTTAMSFTPVQKNRAVLYEISSGKHRIIKEADKNNLVYSANFVE